MILDSSAIVAILLREPEHEALQSKLAAAPSLGVGTPYSSRSRHCAVGSP